jgi:hypothetical protein
MTSAAMPKTILFKVHVLGIDGQVQSSASVQVWRPGAGISQKERVTMPGQIS